MGVARSRPRFSEMIEIKEPVYPLGHAEFTRTLMTGHGRALIHAERYGTEDQREEIRDAALFPKVYDAQCNGYGEEWLARLCGMAGLVESLISQDHGITGHAKLRCSLLMQFALQGHAAAPSALRQMCRYDRETNDLLACYEIVELDGEEGFLFAADRIGARLLADPDFWTDDSLLCLLDGMTSGGVAMKILDRESSGNPNLAAYRKAVLEREAKQPAPLDRTSPPVDELIEQIRNSRQRMPRLLYFGRHATPEERGKVAAMDFTKLEAVALENYLSYFMHLGFPEFRKDQLPLLRHPEERVRWRAHAVLSHHPEPPVRQAAYEALGRDEVASFVKLLRSSGLPEDTELVLGTIGAAGILANADEAHEVVSALRDLVADNRKMNDLRIPMGLYEYSPCRNCRHAAVEIMAERSILPRWIAEECLSDAYDGIREIAAEYLGVAPKF